MESNQSEILIMMNQSVNHGEVTEVNMKALISRLEKSIEEKNIELKDEVLKAIKDPDLKNSLKFKIGLPFLLEYEIGISGEKALAKIKEMVPESWGDMLDKYYAYQRKRL
jgi:hypothetical protein